MAGDPVYAPLLLGLGVDSLSMTPSSLPGVKFIVRAMKMAERASSLAEALKSDSAKEIFAKCDASHRTRADRRVRPLIVNSRS